MTLDQTRRPEPARKSLRRVVLSVVVSSLGAIAALVLVGCAARSDGPQSAAGPGQGPEEDAPPVPPQVGEMAPDFTLRDLEGRQARLSDYRGRMPVVIEFGSLSCPIVTSRTGDLDRLAQEYRGKAEFWFVYANEAHPGHGEMLTCSYGTCRALPQVQDYDDRREHARLFQSTMKTSRRILVDEDGAGSVAVRYGIHGYGIVTVDTRGCVCSVGEVGPVPGDLLEVGAVRPRRAGRAGDGALARAGVASGTGG
jgi:hypothetical protein